ncbi:hypothetical protein Tco_1531987 [Tanacetum coccineum]
MFGRHCICLCDIEFATLGAYDLGVATPRALVYAGLMTSGDARSWCMISGDAKSWVLSVLHTFAVILHNCPTVKLMISKEVLAGQLSHYEEEGRVDRLVEEVVELEVDPMIQVMVGLMVKVANQGSDQGNGRNQNGDAVNDNIRGDVRNVIKNNDHRGCTYKDFLACNPKEYDGKGGAIAYTRWIEKMESVQDMIGCRDNHKVKYTARSFVGKALT